MNCREIESCLVAWMEGALDPDKAEQVERHIESCPSCAGSAEELAGLQESLLAKGKELAGRRLETDVMDRIFREQVTRSRQLARRSRIARTGLILTAAAVLVAALIFFQRPDEGFFEGSTESAVLVDPPAADELPYLGPKLDDWIDLPNMSKETSPKLNSLHSLGYGGGGGGGVNAVVVNNATTWSRISKTNLGTQHATFGENLKSLGYANDPGSTFGFSVGGAKDIANFRENIAKGFLPLPSDITCEGLFYDYYFDMNDSYRSRDLFYPSYLAAVTRDPFSHREECYLAVGLNSGLESFARKKLNLVVVLDISGSMDSAFDVYHYDKVISKRLNLSPEEMAQEAGKKKIEVACESLAALLDHLKPDDRLGLVVFSDQAHLRKPLRYVGATDMVRLREHVAGIQASGSTNMSDGMRVGASCFDEFANIDPEEYENRIIFLTDAQPNRGEIGESGLLGMASRQADRGVYTTFIGVGVDFNTELVEAISLMRGANYYSVHSSREFRKRLGEEFEFMVTPLVFDLRLNLESAGYRIEKVYGAPGADTASGNLLKIHTLFPSRRTEERTRGGVVLLKLSRKELLHRDDSIFLSVSYEDRAGKAHRSERTICFAPGEAERFDNKGIRKAVLLARYGELMRSWLMHTRLRSGITAGQPHLPQSDDFIVSSETGIIVVPRPAVQSLLGRWERTSVALSVDAHYRKLFASFKSYFAKEMEAVDDKSLRQEIEILDRLGR